MKVDCTIYRTAASLTCVLWLDLQPLGISIHQQHKDVIPFEHFWSRRVFRDHLAKQFQPESLDAQEHTKGQWES